MLVKFCGLTRQKDVDTAQRVGADMCGFIFHEQSPRYISPKDAAELQSGTMKRVGVFVQQGLEEIRHIMEEARLDYAQLHGGQDVECAEALGAQRVIRVLWPYRYAHRALLHNDLLRYSKSCAYYLLDAGLKGGGSGKKLDWEDLSTLRPPLPWLLAGGLGAGNVTKAISMCHPGGVDFNSGVEDVPGIKNAHAMKAAVAAVKNYEGLVLNHEK
ncbi:MAG: phosphoribosylanthranilate isomerase [Desulfovibrio sp.]|nr:phosphoribosylanthranilate isomerase [Desulfovibrio sp.]